MSSARTADRRLGLSTGSGNSNDCSSSENGCTQGTDASCDKYELITRAVEHQHCSRSQHHSREAPGHRSTREFLQGFPRCGHAPSLMRGCAHRGTGRRRLEPVTVASTSMRYEFPASARTTRKWLSGVASSSASPVYPSRSVSIRSSYRARSSAGRAFPFQACAERRRWASSPSKAPVPRMPTPVSVAGRVSFVPATAAPVSTPPTGICAIWGSGAVR